MTSDAKIGLLLGSVFIFMIAFVINGLPKLREDRNNNELTTNMVNSQNSPLGLGAKERKVRREVINHIEPIKKIQSPSIDNQNIRFKTPLPKNISTTKETAEVKPAAPVRPSAAVEKKVRPKARPVKPLSPKVYTVREGDNLAAIAKKFYGPRQGNKRTNIIRIFQANSKFLKSPDEIYVGQKLIIPPLPNASPDKEKIGGAFSYTIFKKVESVGRRHLPSNSNSAQQSKWYTVLEGDSLWLIATEQLGNANRYSEIVKLNADLINDEDTLVVGMRLKMPIP